MNAKTLRILAKTAFFVYVALVLFLCFWNFQDTPDVPKSLFGIPMDKIVHFCMFLPFPILAYLGFDRHTEKVWQSVLAVAVTFCAGMLLALLTEFGQSLTDYRSGDPFDLAADTLGLAVGSLIVLVKDVWKQSKNK